MLFGYLLVRNLLFLVRVFSRLPRRWSCRFAAGLNAATRPFHVVNYLGSLGGARLLGHPRMERAMDRAVTGRLEVYLYVIQHYRHHRRRLTVSTARSSDDEERSA